MSKSESKEFKSVDYLLKNCPNLFKNKNDLKPNSIPKKKITGLYVFPAIPKDENISEIPKFLLESSRFYQKSRFQKLYGVIEDDEQIIPNSFFTRLLKYQMSFPSGYFEIDAFFMIYDDLGDPTKNKYEFIQNTGKILHFTNTSMKYYDDYIATKVFCRGESLLKIIKTLSNSHYINISYKNTDQNLGICSNDVLLSDRIKHFQKNQTTPIPKIQKFYHLHSPDPEFFERISEGIFSWVDSKRATTIRPFSSINGTNLRYYRNIYHENQKFPLIYGDMDTLLQQILRGAFTWIVDSHSMKNKVPVAPFIATIDIDVKDIEYTSILDRVFDFYSYCKDIVRITPILTHSGNSSFHFKFFMGEIKENTAGQLLPKLISFETYYRRHKEELNITFIKNAIDLLILSYNNHTELEPVACNFKKYKRAKFHQEYFDNRTGIFQGARTPGSWHHKSDRFSRVFNFEKLPSSLSELHATLSQDYISDHPKVLLRPAISNQIRTQNTKRLLDFTNEYYTKNFNQLVYEERIYND